MTNYKAQIEELAREDPYAYAIVANLKRGVLYENLLGAAVIALIGERQRLLDEVLRYKQECICMPRFFPAE